MVSDKHKLDTPQNPLNQDRWKHEKCLILTSDHSLFSSSTECRHELFEKLCVQLTLQFLSSAVVSSNSSPSLKEISVFLKVLWVRITTLSPSWLMITVGLVTLPTCRVAKPTPDQRTQVKYELVNNQMWTFHLVWAGKKKSFSVLICCICE